MSLVDFGRGADCWGCPLTSTPLSREWCPNTTDGGIEQKGMVSCINLFTKSLFNYPDVSSSNSNFTSFLIRSLTLSHVLLYIQVTSGIQFHLIFLLTYIICYSFRSCVHSPDTTSCYTYFVTILSELLCHLSLTPLRSRSVPTMYINHSSMYLLLQFVNLTFLTLTHNIPHHLITSHLSSELLFTLSLLPTHSPCPLVTLFTKTELWPSDPLPTNIPTLTNSRTP